MPVYRLDVAYDGSEFHGFARQPDVRTVQGEIEAALETILRVPVLTVGAGRTDAGVHARGQVVSFTVDDPVEVERLGRSLNRMLRPEIAVIAVGEAPDGFDARFSARSRVYRYQVLATPVHDPLRRHHSWHVPEPLDVDAMERAAVGFLGEHDFASFCRAAPGRSTVRTVLQSRWEVDGDLMVYEVEAHAFCHQMVRSIVGFCVDAGRGRVDPGSVADVLASRDRAAARPIAPPQGLILWEVRYDRGPETAGQRSGA